MAAFALENKLDAFPQTSEDRSQPMQELTQPHAQERRQTCWGAFLLFLVVLIWFSPWWFGGRVLAPLDLPGQVMQPWVVTTGVPQVRNHFVTDAITQYLPYRMFAEKSYREDGYIGWCSSEFQGFPQDANTMGLFSDWTMQLHRWLPFWTAWHVGLAGQFLIAGWGMLFFLRNRGVSGPAAWAGAMAYMGNAQFIIWIYHRWALGAFCWVPWILWAIYRSRFSKKIDIAPPIFLALAFCGGTLQHAAYTSLAYGSVALGIFWQRESRGLRKAQIIHFTVWFLVGITLAAFYLMPAVEAFLTNLKLGNVRGQISYSGGWRQPFFNLISYPATIFPWIFGRVASLDLWKICQSSLIDLGWFGFLPTLLAFLAIFWKKTPLPARILMIVGWVIPLTPLVGPLYHRVVLLSILGGVWSFCLLLENGVLDDKFYRRSWAIGCGLVGLWLIGSMGLTCFQEAIYKKLLPSILNAAMGSQFGSFTEWTAERTHRFLAECVIWNWTKIIPLTLAFAALGIARKWHQWNHLRWLLGGVVALETSFFFIDWTTWSSQPQEGILPASSLVKVIAKEVGPDQLLYQPEVGPIYLSGPAIAKLALPPNLLMPQGVPVLTGYESIMPPRIWQNLHFSTKPPVLNTIGVSHILLAANEAAPKGWKWIATEQGRSLWENPFVPPHYRCWGDATTDVPQAPSILLRTENHRIFQVPPHTVKVQVVENWHPGWRYRLGSENWHSIRRSMNGGLIFLLPNQDLPLTVEMRYFPKWYGFPGGISMATAAILMALGLWRRLIRERQ